MGSAGTTKGVCQELDDNGILQDYNCKRFIEGCPAQPYLTETIYKYPYCLLINTDQRCYLVEEDCPPVSSVTTDSQISATSVSPYSSTSKLTILSVNSTDSPLTDGSITTPSPHRDVTNLTESPLWTSSGTFTSFAIPAVVAVSAAIFLLVIVLAAVILVRKMRKRRNSTNTDEDTGLMSFDDKQEEPNVYDIHIDWHINVVFGQRAIINGTDTWSQTTESNTTLSQDVEMVSWIKGNGSLATKINLEDKKYTGSSCDPRNPVLIINNTDLNDNGIYQLQINDRIKKIQLRVNEKAADENESDRENGEIYKSKTDKDTEERDVITTENHRFILETNLLAKDVKRCRHISSVSSEVAWVSDDYGKLMQINKLGDIKKKISAPETIRHGSHTVTKNGNFLFIGSDKENIYRDAEEKPILYHRNNEYVMLCIFSSPKNGDLLIGGQYHDQQGVVSRYNAIGDRCLQTIQVNKARQNLYKIPRFITENINGDIIVSDYKKEAIVVVEKSGKHRFTYRGLPPEFLFRPRGACTDTFGRILVCDPSSVSVHILTMDGQYLFNLRTTNDGITSPCSVCIDNKEHLWVVDDYTNKILIYRPTCIPTSETDKDTQEGDVKMIEDLTIKQETELRTNDVNSCRHISSVSSECAWVSDDYGKLMLINKLGEIKKKISGIKTTRFGSHTVTKSGDFLFIDSDNENIYRDAEEEPILYHRNNAYDMLCIFSSPINGDLLIGGQYHDQQGVVSRYNAIGDRCLQTIQVNEARRNLYEMPRFITENINGDVIVSDYKKNAIVVVDKSEKYRFTYNGRPPEFLFRPRGVCTDTSGRILVCDPDSESVHILTMDGNYLSNLPTSKNGITSPYSLCMDNKECLWVVDDHINKLLLYIDLRHDSSEVMYIHDRLKELVKWFYLTQELSDKERATILYMAPRHELH